MSNAISFTQDGTVVTTPWLFDVNAATYTPAANLVGSVARSSLSKFADIVSVKDFGAAGDGTTDDTAAINLAIAAVTSTYGAVYFPIGRYLISSTITLPKNVSIFGCGISESLSTGATNRGASTVVRGFTGTTSTLVLSSETCSIDEMDFDGNNQGTGDGVTIIGSRCRLGRVSTRNFGGAGVRIGQTAAGASAINANCWRIDFLISYNNNIGLRIDDTNTSVSTSYPLGQANANGGVCINLDAHTNVSDGLQIGNANDNVFVNVTSQTNGGCGIRFKTDGTNAGPRCNHILGNDCENNTGNDIQIDAATLPAAAPGLYNVIVGNRSVAVASRIVDNSTGSFVQQWNGSLTSGERAYHSGETLNIVNATASGISKLMLYADTNLANVGSIRGKQTGTSGGQLEAWVKGDGNIPARAMAWDNKSNTILDGLLATSAAAPTIASANTIAPIKPITFISGTTVLKTITAPSPISAGGGQITLIPTGSWSTDATGNIALATTAVPNKALIMTYDTTTGKWYPSY